MMPRATGDNSSDRRFSCEAATTKIVHEITTKLATNPGESIPAGRARVRVRGLAASMEASASRLNAMAAERAETIATTIQSSACAVGQPPAAKSAPHKANGNTKTECCH